MLHKEQRTWFFAVLTLLIGMLALYVYFVSASVVQVVMRKEINQEISSISSHISKLEAQYIDEQHAVSDDVASMKGYVAIDDKVFIDRTESTLVLSNNNES